MCRKQLPAKFNQDEIKGLEEEKQSTLNKM